MKTAQIIVLGLLIALPVPTAVVAQGAAGEVAHQLPVVEGVERPDSPKVDETEGNAEAQLPQVQPGAGSNVRQPQVEVPPMPQQPKVQQD